MGEQSFPTATDMMFTRKSSKKTPITVRPFIFNVGLIKECLRVILISVDCVINASGNAHPDKRHQLTHLSQLGRT